MNEKELMVRERCHMVLKGPIPMGQMKKSDDSSMTGLRPRWWHGLNRSQRR